MLICCFIFSYRKLALFLCDWDITEENLRERLHRLVTNNQTERAEQWHCFTINLTWQLKYWEILQLIKRKVVKFWVQKCYSYFFFLFIF